MMRLTKLMVTLSASLWSGADARRRAVSENVAEAHTLETQGGKGGKGGKGGPLPQFPLMNNDRNPIGRGNIPAAYGLLVQIFGPRGGLRKEDLRSVVVERRFPSNYTFPGRLESRAGRPPRSARRNRMSSAQLRNVRTGDKPFDFERSAFVEADLRNVNFIICPFFSTMMWEGGIEFKQWHSEEELMQAAITAGLTKEVSEEHVGDNFFHNPAGRIDIWNMEGVMNEHVSSTGINDCVTDFEPDCFQTNRRERGSFGFACNAFTDRSCFLPRADIFETFWDAADVNENGRLTEQELGVVAARDCPGPPTTPCECALPRSSGDCQLGDDEFPDGGRVSRLLGAEE